MVRCSNEADGRRPPDLVRIERGLAAGRPVKDSGQVGSPHFDVRLRVPSIGGAVALCVGELLVRGVGGRRAELCTEGAEILLAPVLVSSRQSASASASMTVWILSRL